MKNLLSCQILATVAVMGLCGMSCSSREEFHPQLDVLSGDGSTLSGRSINYGEAGGSTEVLVRSNAEWSIVSDASWLEISPSCGTGDGSVVISAGASDASRSGVVEIALTASPQVRMSFDVVQYVEPEEDPQYEIIYRDCFDGAAASPEYGDTGDGWPAVGEFGEFAVAEGCGADLVAYTADGVTVRSDMWPAESDYAGASGRNNLFLAEYSMLEVSGISLRRTDSDLCLSFGRWVSAECGDGDQRPAVWISGDGKRWSRIRYDSEAPAGKWHKVECGFSLAAVPSSLQLAFVGSPNGAVRIDDVSLCTGAGGASIDLDKGGEIEREEPPAAPPAERNVTVADIVAMMPEADGRTVADESGDLLFDAVVQNDFAGGNCTASMLVLADEGAVDAGCGVALCGDGVDAASAGLACGERVHVRLKRGAAILCNVNGAMYVTGEDGTAWFELEPSGSAAEVTVASIDVRRMAEYQNMTVEVADVESGSGGVWCDAGDGEHVFSAAGEAVRLFVRGGAAAFANKRFGAAHGCIRGIVVMRGGEAWLCPRNGGDVEAFDVEEPLPPMAVTIPEIIASLRADGTPVVIDGARDRVLTAVVMNDTPNGNCNPSHLILAAEGASGAGNGITLYGSCVTPAALGVKRGDMVAVTLKASEAVAVMYDGMYEITGDEASEWAEVEILSSGHEPAVTDIAASQLSDYQGMAVRIKGAVPESGGLWYDAACGGEIGFTADGGPFTVRVLPSAVFADDTYVAVEGDIVGLAAVTDGKAVLMPRDGSDVSAYAYTGDTGYPDDPGDDSGEDPSPGTPVDPIPAPDDDGKYVMVNSLSDLKAGAYHIGGYRNGRLYLACGGLTPVNHCNTAEFFFDGESLKSATAAAAVVTLEAAGVENGYYIRFDGDGYLSAAGSGAGMLRFTQSRAEYWIFSENASGGFDLLLSGDKFVRLVVSKTATEALLRSVAADEEGNAVVLIRIGTETGR